jgi:hypothetical protein
VSSLRTPLDKREFMLTEARANKVKGVLSETGASVG